jgi:murein DD-endopeptidase MepM/ murein hydrolase activator NlpD
VHLSSELRRGFARLRALQAFLTNSASGSALQRVQSALRPQSLENPGGFETNLATSTSSVIKTVSISARKPAPVAAPALAARPAAARHSHVSASVIMALFVGGSGALSVLPEMPDAQRWFVPHPPQRIALGPPRGSGDVVEASIGGNAQTLFLDSLKPNVADDLTQVQAMPETKTVTVRPGDTLSELLTEAGATPQDAHSAVTALRAHFDPRSIQAGQDIELTLGPPVGTQDAAAANDDQNRRLLGFSVQTDPTTHVQVGRDDADGFTAQVTEARLTERPVRAVATIDSSLFIAAEDAGIPDITIVDLIRLYSYDIDFQREIQKGDSFEVYFTQMVNERNQVVQNGRILYAALTTGGKTHRLWRYTTKDESLADYYDENGRSAKKFLMRTPVDGARLTSGYGMRMHPIEGYTKMHKGVDFGAPMGTPVMAAGSGTIEYAGPYSTYGNYVRIRHTNGYKTAYAHLKGFARGIKVGAHVTQGQTIAYVGMTGHATGPHLHYEVLVRDHQVNPMGIKVATGQQLEGKQLAEFEAMRSRIGAQMAEAAQLGHTTTASVITGNEPIRR